MNKLRFTPERIEQMSNSDRVEAAQISSRSSISRSLNSGGVSVSMERILSLDQEAQLIQWIEEEIDLNHAVTKDRIKKRVCTMFTERVGKPRDSVSDDWWLNFRNNLFK
ncbi:hypothetical protein ACTFIY_011024 [Dictyostelium cf. discoideum]